MKKMNRLIIILVLIVLINLAYADEIKVNSPNNKLTVLISTQNQLSYAVKLNNNNILESSPISLTLKNGDVLGENPNLLKQEINSVNQILTPVVKVKTKEIIDNYNETELHFDHDFGIIVRVYDDGVAYRFFTKKRGEITIISETANFNFSNNCNIYFPAEKSKFTAFQRNYEYTRLSSITSKDMCITPALVEYDDKIKVAITEADLQDYPGMFLKGKDDQYGLIGEFAKQALHDDPMRSGVEKKANYLAKTYGKRTFPWRVIVITDNDADLLKNQMVYKLAPENKLKNTDWIKPGNVAWDWWNALNVYNVDFRAGINTQTYQYYMDFAAENGIDYVILDEGWSDTYDVFDLNPNIDMDELARHSKATGVGLVLWCEWSNLRRQLEPALDQFEKWGIKGIKVDFMNRDDQDMVNFYWDLAREAAEREILVNFHGSFKPTGIRRAYPNVITREGVKGMEQSKWSTTANPEYDLTIPFIRMLAGPMDYTPGAMLNAGKANFASIFNHPMSLGTRCHQLAMYVLFESPMQMLSDSPTNYNREKECLEFIASVPTVWDELEVLKADISNLLVLARKSGDEWYIGAMTDWDARTVDIDFSFLEDGQKYKMVYFKDGINADRCAMDYKKQLEMVTKNDNVTIKMTSGGGWAARLIPVK